MKRVKISLASIVLAAAVAGSGASATAAMPAPAGPPATLAPGAFAEGPPTGVLGVCTPSWGSIVLPICV
jgi:hypothetical protein